MQGTSEKPLLQCWLNESTYSSSPDSLINAVQAYSVLLAKGVHLRNLDNGRL